MKKLNKYILALVLLLVSLTSCSSIDDDVFTAGIVADFQSISPGVDIGALSKSVLMNMNGYLYRYDPDAKMFEPALAEKVTYDNGILTIVLKDNIYFHNDQPVTSEDVAYSLSRNGGLIPGFINSDPLLRGLYTEEDFNIIDDKTLQVTLDQSLVTSNTKYSIFNTVIVPKDYPESEQEIHPISAGPYEFVSYTPGDNITFTKFDSYFDPSAQIEDVVFKIIPDPSTALLAYENGELDYLQLTSEDIDNLDEKFQDNIYTDLSNDSNVLFFNTTREPFNDPEIIKAIKYGIDKDELIKIATDNIGAAQASVLSPYQEHFYNDNLKVDEYDPELSKRILEAKGYSDTNRLTINLKVVSENKITVDMANLVKSYLSEIYIDVNILEVPWSTYFNEVYMNKDFDATILQLAGYDNPYETLTFFKTGETGNLSGYSSEDYDKVLDEILKTNDINEQINLIHEAQEILFFDSPAIFLGDEGKIAGLSEDYTNLKFYPYWYIDISNIQKVEN